MTVPSSPLKHLRLIAAIMVALSWSLATSHAQGWEPAGSIDGWHLSPFPYTLNGQTVITGWKHENHDQITQQWTIESILSSKEPLTWDREFEVIQLNRVYDGNGNGLADLAVSTTTSGPRTAVLLDAFTESERVLVRDDIAKWPAFTSMNTYQGDLDGDGVQDDFAVRRYSDSFAVIVYGDREDPWTQYSIVPGTVYNPEYEDTYIAAIGLLDGKPCMVQLVFKSEGFDNGYYQLMELNQDDITSRRDTIRSTLLHETDNPGRWLFDKIVLRADTVWHLYHRGYPDGPTATLRVSRSGIKIVQSDSPLTKGDQWVWYGQGKKPGDYSYPTVIDATRPFMTATSITEGAFEREVARVFVCTNTDDASVQVLGECLLPWHKPREGAIAASAVIPDQDGDGIDDIVVTHAWTDLNTAVEQKQISVFLTTQRSATGSIQDPPSFDQSTYPDQYEATFNGSSWVVQAAAPCIGNQPLGTIYSITGQVQCQVPLAVTGEDVQINPDGCQITLPAWCVVGECVVRLQ